MATLVHPTPQEARQDILTHELRVQLHESEAKRAEYIPPFANLIDVEEDWDKFWLRQEMASK